MMSDDLTIDKQSLRAECAAIRARVDDAAAKKASQAIAGYLLQRIKTPGIVAGYCAVRGEIDVTEALAKEKEFGLPFKLTDKDKDGQRYIDGFKKQISEKVSANYGKLSGVIDSISKGDAGAVAANLNKNQFSSDISSGVQHEGNPQVSPGGKQGGQGIARGGVPTLPISGPGAQSTPQG
jgi:hypothetical protein